MVSPQYGHCSLTIFVGASEVSPGSNIGSRPYSSSTASASVESGIAASRRWRLFIVRNVGDGGQKTKTPLTRVPAGRSPCHAQSACASQAWGRCVPCILVPVPAAENQLTRPDAETTAVHVRVAYKSHIGWKLDPKEGACKSKNSTCSLSSISETLIDQARRIPLVYIRNQNQDFFQEGARRKIGYRYDG